MLDVKSFYLPLYIKIDYQAIWDLQPLFYPAVSVFNKEKNIYEDKIVYRKYISYGETPEFKTTGKSYMFNNQEEGIPPSLSDLLVFAQTLDSRFNNVYVNWYQNGLDYIEPHSDCNASLKRGSPILIVNLNGGLSKRQFVIESKSDVIDKLVYVLEDKLCLSFNSDEQVNYRHHVPVSDCEDSRISVTFRCVDKNI